MRKVGLIAAITAILLVGLTIFFNSSGPTGGAATALATGISSNIVTLAAVVAIAGIVIVTMLKKD
jgi:hypothetical protein